MSPRPAQWKQVEVSGAQSHSLGPKSRVLSRMTTTSPCFYEPIAFRRLLIFHKFLSFATLPFSFQTFEGGNLKKWRGFNCWFSAHSLLPSSDGWPALRVGWMVEPPKKTESSRHTIGRDSFSSESDLQVGCRMFWGKVASTCRPMSALKVTPTQMALPDWPISCSTSQSSF